MKFFPVCDYTKYRNIVKNRKLINNVFFPNEIKKYISENRLLYFQIGEQLFLLYDEAEYYQLICEEKGFPDIIDFTTIGITKPIACHVIENKNNDSTAEIKNFLLRNGFRLRCTIHKYARNLENLPDISSTDAIVCNEITNISDCRAIIKLWQDNLPMYEVPNLQPEDIKALADQKKLVYLKDPTSGRVIGARAVDVFMGTATGHHNVVDPAFRGKGYGHVLLVRGTSLAAQLGARTATVWIEDTNTISQNNVCKAGFKRTSSVSYQYILQMNANLN